MMDIKTLIVQEVLRKTDKITDYFMKEVGISESKRENLRSLLMALYVNEFTNNISALKDLMIEIGDEYDRKSPEEFKIHLSEMAKRINVFRDFPEQDITSELQKYV